MQVGEGTANMGREGRRERTLYLGLFVCALGLGGQGLQAQVSPTETQVIRMPGRSTGAPVPPPLLRLDSMAPIQLCKASRRLYLEGRLDLLLDAWLIATPGQHTLIAQALRAGGLEAARDLIPSLGSEDPMRAQAALALLLAMDAQEALIQSLRHADPSLRQRARQGLIRMGATCLPRLTEELRRGDRAWRSEAFVVLEGMGLVASRELAQLLDDPDFFSRVSPILVNYGTVGFEGILDRWERLTEPQRELILRQMHNREARSRRILLGIIRFGSSERACVAVDVLARSGDTQSLVRVLGLARKTVRARALARVMDLGPKAIPEIAPLLRDQDPGLRRLALDQLRTLGRPAWPRLAGLLVGGDPALRLEAVVILIRTGEPGLTALGRVHVRTDGKSLALLYPSLRKQRAELLPHLLGSLESRDSACLRTSLDILAALGACDELAQALRGKNPVLQPLCRHTLIQAGRASVPAILRELARDEPTSRPGCLAVLDTLGSVAMPALVRALEDPALRAQATVMLRRLTRTTKPGR